MKRFAWLPLSILVAAPAAHALEAACETYLTAAEKSSAQPARHTVNEVEGMPPQEGIVAGGVLYAKIQDKWQKIAPKFGEMEKKLHDDVRSGKIGISGCKALGDEKIDGKSYSVVEYTLSMPNVPPSTAKVYVGKDGLIHRTVAAQVTTKMDYEGVKAPEL